MQAAVQDMYLELVDVDVEDWSPAVVSAEVHLTGTLAGAHVGSSRASASRQMLMLTRVRLCRCLRFGSTYAA
jgi:hypothetical protein